MVRRDITQDTAEGANVKGTVGRDCQMVLPVALRREAHVTARLMAYGVAQALHGLREVSA